MNIFGEGFPDEVKKQIKQRQKVHSSGYEPLRTPEDIVYLNSKTSFCRLISGVDILSSKDINNPTIKSLNLSSGPELAKTFVLSNGTSFYNDIDGSLTQRAGVASFNNIYGDAAAYGIGGTDFGLNPMMGILSADIKHENRGSLRTAVVSIKAFNKQQFEIIDALYLRLGFSVLLEWGHTIWYDNNEKLVLNGDNSLAKEFLDAIGEKEVTTITTYNTPQTTSSPNTTNNPENPYDLPKLPPPPPLSGTEIITEKFTGKLTYNDILALIYNKRLSSGGNYDAMLAVVRNFSWTFNKDGSYDITLYLSSIGDIIESLKINMLTSAADPSKNGPTNPVTTENGITEEEMINIYANNSTISNFLYLCKGIIDNARPDATDIALASLNSNTTSYITNNFIDFNLSVFDFDKDDLMLVKLKNGTSFSFGLGWFTGNYFTTNYDKLYYIRLGSFLRFLQHYVIPQTYTKGNLRGTTLGVDDDEQTNIMLSHRLQISNDPRICFVIKDILLPNYETGVQEYYTYGRSDSKNRFINKDITDGIGEQNKDIFYGNIMNIYIDFGFILKKINELKDDKGNLSLIDFLKGILAGLNESLGGINDLDVFIDETQNIIRIIDKNPLPYEDKVIDIINSKFPLSYIRYNYNKPYNKVDNSPIIQLYGYSSSNQAGFIKDFGLTTELSPQFSTMITVGAAARGSVVGENETALSRLNYGFEDRFKHTISNSPSLVSSNAAPDSETDYNNRLKELNNMKTDYINFLKKMNNGTESNPTPINAQTTDVETYKTNLSSLLQKANEVDKMNNLLFNKKTTLNYNGAGFIPFNLNLTMDGLSGIKINQQFLLNTEYLPTNYPSTMKFLIKNLSHEIKDNKWNTKIETYCVPKYLSVGDDKSLLWSNDEKVSKIQSEQPEGVKEEKVVPFDQFLNSAKFVYPVTAKVTSPIGFRTISGNRKFHYGIDLGASVGTPIYSACDGKVIQIGGSGIGPYAVLIQVDPSCYKNSNQNIPIYIWYGHNSASSVKVGQQVTKGQLIGKVGNEGRSSGPHLHLEIFQGPNPGTKKQFLDPQKYDLGRGASVIANQPFKYTPDYSNTPLF